ncbi:unknown protein [Seminavis robusta]|uniref:Uncharacterized protein n=1 Tax=Seminavis robusta TaxID=568900 RepID=A0A9N8DXB2_9STRA|nr:unknown protein [Seminavis robusta]|eukprot:Sro416_g138590.1 n/a (254) ;mRNA; f:24665-25426
MNNKLAMASLNRNKSAPTTTSSGKSMEMKMNKKTARLLSALLHLTKHEKSNSPPNKQDLDETSAMSLTEEFSETAEFIETAVFSAPRDTQEEQEEVAQAEVLVAQEEVAQDEQDEEDSEVVFEFDVDDFEALAGLDIDNLGDLLCLMGLDDEPHRENAEEAPRETAEIQKGETPTVQKHALSKKRPSKKSDQHGRFQDDILRRLQKQLKETKAAYTPYTYGRNGLAVDGGQEQADYDDNETSQLSTSTDGPYY